MELELPPGWRLSNESTLVWQRFEGPWRLTAWCPMGAPFDGPTTVEITLVGSLEAVEAADKYGVPVDVLRAFPLGEIKAQARSLLPAVRRALGWSAPLPNLPKTCRTDADYARWALAYLLLVEEKTSSPVKALMELTGMAQSTVSTRISNARKRGFLGPDGMETAGRAIALESLNNQEGN